MGAQFSQIFPPTPSFTESSLASLSGKVYIVTGASAGVGRELARLLYSLHATVYVAARNATKANAAISWMRTAHPNSTGTLHFLALDLNDLEGIKPSAEAFLRKEKRLDVLFNNAGVMIPPKGSTTKQGHDMQLGTNCLAPFLFTRLLTPLLISTARTAEQGSVRVVWVSSSAAHLASPRGGVDVSNLGYARDGSVSVEKRYAVSKGGNVLHAIEFGKRVGGEGVVSVPLNPGNLKSELQRHVTPVFNFLLGFMLYPPVNGAYTELFAGLSPEVPAAKKGTWVVPFGRVMPLRKDFADGGNGKEFWEWSEKQVERYM